MRAISIFKIVCVCVCVSQVLSKECREDIVSCYPGQWIAAASSQPVFSGSFVRHIIIRCQVCQYCCMITMSHDRRAEQEVKHSGTAWLKVPFGPLPPIYCQPCDALGRLNRAGWRKERRREAAGTWGGDRGASSGCQPRRRARSVWEPKTNRTDWTCAWARTHTTQTHTQTKAYAGWTVPLHLSCWPLTNRPQQGQSSDKLSHKLWNC